MRAIAVLDAPAEIGETEATTGEVITYGAQQERIMERNEAATEESRGNFMGYLMHTRSPS